MKSGFVILAGRSNVGKSTLLNALVGSKVAIVSPKPQTTRHPVRGVLHDPRGQIVFVDTPGLFLGKADPVSKRLNQLVEESLDGIDAIVYVVDPTRAPGKEEELIREILRKISVPIIVAVNKSDLPAVERPYLGSGLTVNVGQRATLDISAKSHANLNTLIDTLINLLPEGEPYYPDMQISDLAHKEWLEELIREKCFFALQQELPYTIKVDIDDMEIREDGSRYIEATVWTTDDRYKGMIIGAKGSKLKEIGGAARKELEGVTNAKVFLDLHVKVDPKWPARFR
jgi:GTP-binding protein Era